MPECRWYYELFRNHKQGYQAAVKYLEIAYSSMKCDQKTIESGNKIVLQKRLKQAGMRWEPQSAQYLLTLKSKYESGRWETDVVDFVKQYFK